MDAISRTTHFGIHLPSMETGRSPNDTFVKQLTFQNPLCRYEISVTVISCDITWAWLFPISKLPVPRWPVVPTNPQETESQCVEKHGHNTEVAICREDLQVKNVVNVGSTFSLIEPHKSRLKKDPQEYQWMKKTMVNPVRDGIKSCYIHTNQKK